MNADRSACTRRCSSVRSAAVHPRVGHAPQRHLGPDAAGRPARRSRAAAERATADNPRGYWDAPRIAQLTNRLLESAGTRWNGADAIPEDRFASPARAADRAEATWLLDAEFPDPSTFVLEDSRICRLLPFRRPILAAVEIAPYALLMLRDPEEVARSLTARAGLPRFSPAAVVAPERAALFRLRHVIDAERRSRGLPRQAVEHSDLLADWRVAVAGRTGLVAGDAAAQLGRVARAADHRLGRPAADGPRGPGLHGGPLGVRGLGAARRSGLHADRGRWQTAQQGCGRITVPSGAQPSVMKEFVEPLGMPVLIRKDENRQTTRGGIVLPNGAGIPTISGRVVEVSLQVERDADVPIAKYDNVLFDPKHAIPVNREGNNLLFVVPVEDVVAVFPRTAGRRSTDADRPGGSAPGRPDDP